MFRTAYGEKPKVSFQAPEGERSRTKQSMKQECDINFIIRQYRKTGLVNHVKQYQGMYGDFDAVDLHEAMNIIADAQEMFATVPAAIRKEFNNDPAEFVSFVTNPENLPRLRELGLATGDAGAQPATPLQGEAATSGQASA